MTSPTARYPNRFRAHILGRLALLISLPVFVVSLGVGVLEVAYLKHAWTPGTLTIILAASAGVSLLITLIGALSTLTHCPPMLEGEGSSLHYSRLRWVRSRPGWFQMELPIASVRSVGPTAFGATQIEGMAFAHLSTQVVDAAREVSELLLVAPETAQMLGLSPTRTFASWIRRADGKP